MPLEVRWIDILLFNIIIKKHTFRLKVSLFRVGHSQETTFEGDKVGGDQREGLLHNSPLALEFPAWLLITFWNLFLKWNF